MKALIGPKVEPNTPYSEELAWLFADETSLDKIVDRIVIPICIACDYPDTATAKTRNPAYIKKIQDQVASIRDYFKTRVPPEVKIVCIFVPLDNKKELEQRVNQKIGSFL